MKKMSTFLDETMYIMLKCIMHLHGHWNKAVSLVKLFILADFSNALNSIITFVGQLMTFEAIVSCVGLATSTSATKT
jgi:hypothetical protein